MYKLNNIELINYGIHAGRASNSNIALSGFLDMPSRLGKTHHDWSDELGTEPYVLAEEIRHGGRDITFYGLMEGADQADAINRVQELYLDMHKFTDLVPLQTPWGTFNVYVKDTVEGKYIGQGWATLQIVFREPIVTMDATIPTGTSIGLYNIDNVGYSDLGAIVTNVKDNFNRPATKSAHFTAYATEGYQVTKMGPIKIVQTLYFVAPDYEALKGNVQKFQQLLAGPGLRVINVDNMERECFNAEGFTVEDIRIMDGQCVCKLTVPLIMVGAGVPVEPAYLLDNYGEAILANIDFIKVDKYALDFITDNDGNRLITNKFEDITL